jgi:S-adenosylhomocysteine hydrolase
MEEKLIDILWEVKANKKHPNRAYKELCALFNMEQKKQVAIRDINDILEAVSRIERQIELIKKGKTKVGETGVNRLDVIKEKAVLIRIIGKRM